MRETGYDSMQDVLNVNHNKKLRPLVMCYRYICEDIKSECVTKEYISKVLQYTVTIITTTGKQKTKTEKMNKKTLTCCF